jgi:acylphosphatase
VTTRWLAVFGLAAAWLAAAAVYALPVGRLPVPGGKQPVARLVHYSGRVQGVGFRATAVEISRDYAVTGWVKNLDDGRVELLVEGPEKAVADFLAAVRARWPKNIDKEEVEERPASGKYKTFEIEK